jgi:transposase-like protein
MAPRRGSWDEPPPVLPTDQDRVGVVRGFRFPPEVTLLAVRWYLRYGLFYRDLEEILAERGVVVDHVTLYRWVQRFTPLIVEAARPCRHTVGDRWFVDETYVKVAGTWRYVYRAVDQYGQVIDVYVSKKRDVKASWPTISPAPRPPRVRTHLWEAVVGAHDAAA